VTEIRREGGTPGKEEVTEGGREGGSVSSCFTWGRRRPNQLRRADSAAQGPARRRRHWSGTTVQRRARGRDRLSSTDVPAAARAVLISITA